MPHLKKIREFINKDEKNVKHGWISKLASGGADTKNRIVILNLYTMIAQLFIHEHYHIQYPYYCEQDIIDLTARKLKSMTELEIKEIASLVLVKIIEDF